MVKRARRKRLTLPQKLMLADAADTARLRPDGGAQTRTAIVLIDRGLLRWINILHVEITPAGRDTLRALHA